MAVCHLTPQPLVGRFKRILIVCLRFARTECKLRERAFHDHGCHSGRLRSLGQPSLGSQ